jgi:cytochrome P450
VTRGRHHARSGRIATVDTEVGGVRIPAGQIVLPWLTAANRDERVFTEPTGSTSTASPTRT